MRKHFLLVSDFDQTLSFNDSGVVLSEMLGIGGFLDRVHALSRLNFVQSGAELAYLLRHDADFRRVRAADLVEAGRRIRLKRNIPLLMDLLDEGIAGYSFDFRVVSAAPEEVVHAALAGIVSPERIVATRFGWDEHTGEVASIERVPAGYGKVAAVDELRFRLGVPRERVVYVGDGSSDIHVMLHVNRGDGLTIAASEARHIAQIARRTVISDDALSVLVPVLEEIAGYEPSEIRALFEKRGLLIQEWDRVRTDWLTIRDGSASVSGEFPRIAAVR
ncbi:MAG: haloacid dehalogenase-like hydrolase [Gemmatimonadaceae bacterium]|nr:haloacid dehalogenase-like hydrolase [Gemmatimonadaceae bacterium]NUQ93017.1 haloacid dehalogenase-like hydrolase [Gemmatimonadaceae bacterium]NUR19415.1 haloacid dehalogenase-like hydrolase [Gemmatimonadaceae bacterium]NUS99164.1 haloacid dehalogenase-like hydrolase [Gemmatimonadaceae bacterium]